MELIPAKKTPILVVDDDEGLLLSIRAILIKFSYLGSGESFCSSGSREPGDVAAAAQGGGDFLALPVRAGIHPYRGYCTG